jgi:hypothetical protein
MRFTLKSLGFPVRCTVRECEPHVRARVRRTKSPGGGLAPRFPDGRSKGPAVVSDNLTYLLGFFVRASS